MSELRSNRFLIQQKVPLNETAMNFIEKKWGRESKAYKVGHKCRALKVATLAEGHFGLFFRQFIHFCIRNGFIDLRYGVSNRFLIQRLVPNIQKNKEWAGNVNPKSLRNLKHWSKTWLDFEVVRLHSAIQVKFHLLTLGTFSDMDERFWSASISEDRYKVFYSFNSLNLTPEGDITG